jgi:hypothetical protein
LPYFLLCPYSAATGFTTTDFALNHRKAFLQQIDRIANGLIQADPISSRKTAFD